MQRLGRILKRLALGLAGVVLVVLVIGFFAVRALVLPDADEFGAKLDEAMQAKPQRTRTSFPAAANDYFAEMENGILQKGRPPAPRMQLLQKATGMPYEELREHVIKGQNTWLVWSGGNDRFWDYMARNSAGAFDLLKLVSSHPDQGYGRATRWSYLGLVNEPCFEKATAESAAKNFGLWTDQRVAGCDEDPFADAKEYPGVKIGARGTRIKDKDGREIEFPVGSYYGKPSGILGLRLFPNPDFNEAAFKHWDPKRYYQDPEYYNDPELVRPFRVGMSCGFCHVSPNPSKAPADPEAPTFANINSNPGAQYFWVNRIFFWNTQPRKAPDQPAPNEGSFIYQVFHTNPPGALDTSFVSTDYMNNPRTMNAVYNVGARLEPTLRWGKETLTGGELDNKQFQDYPQTQALGNFWNPQNRTINTMRVLKDGADSVGVLGALNRVYLNIGLFSEEWLLHFRPLIGGRKISPIRIADAVKNSGYWGASEDMTADMALFFLATATPDSLGRAEGGERFLPKEDDPQVQQGKVVFARNCAACHSSRIPDPPKDSGVDEGICAGGGAGKQYRECWDRYWSWAQSEDFKSKMTQMVLAKGFRDDNFLSTERRVPIDLLQTNACSALATNALAGDIWDNFSSTTYKQLPAVKELTVHHPVSGATSSLQPLGGGRGYTRPASLVSLWSTAPFLQNNSLGHTDYYARPNDQIYAERTASSYAGSYPPSNSPTSMAPAGGCPGGNPEDPYLPCVENRMRVFEKSIHELLNPQDRRRDELLGDKVPGYIYRTSAPSCVVVPARYVPLGLGKFPRLANFVADWAFDATGNLTLGPLPQGFPINALLNTKLLPDNDEAAGMAHYGKLLKAAPTLLGTFKQLGGTCSPEQLQDPQTQVHAERVLKATGMIDTLVGLSKCPDYVVNRGHYFGAELSAEDKAALIQYLKLL
jgi:hypothetical protein